MAYKSKARRPTKELREPIPGNGRKLEPGRFHDVTVITARVKPGAPEQAVVVFKDDFENTHIETVFLYSKNAKDLSNILKQLFAATAKSNEQLKLWYDSLIEENQSVLNELAGTRCSIETGYRDKFINIKTIRSTNDKSNGRDFFQSVEANPSHTKGTPGSGQRKQYIPIPERVASFF